MTADYLTEYRLPAQPVAGLISRILSSIATGFWLAMDAFTDAKKLRVEMHKTYRTME